MDDYAFLSNPVLSSTKFISSQWNPYGVQALGVVNQVMEYLIIVPWPICCMIFVILFLRIIFGSIIF